MKPVLAIAVATAIQEDIILTAVAVEIAVQENLPFFKKSVEGGKQRTQWTSKCMQIIEDYLESLKCVCDTFPSKKISAPNGLQRTLLPSSAPPDVDRGGG